MSLFSGAPRLETLKRPPRLPGLDVARGVAVVSMFVAHFGPNGGVWALSERLTAMLFAMIIGASLMLTAKRLNELGLRGYLLSAAWRCVLLVLIGWLLQRVYEQIDVVLQTLGVLTLVLAPIVWVLRGRILPSLLLAGVSTVLAPIVQSHAASYLADHDQLSYLPTRALEIGFAGIHYRVISFLAPALVGVALVSWWTRRQTDTRGLLLFTGSGLMVAAAGFVVGKRFLGGAIVYSGSLGEIISGTALAAATLAACWAATRLLGSQSGVLAPLISTGKLTLTVYALQILVAWAWVRWVIPGRDDGPILLLGLTILSLVLSTLWDRHLGPGPLERLMRVPRYLIKAHWTRKSA